MKTILLLLLSTFSFPKANATCEAFFTAETDGLTIYLDGSASAGDVASWHWYINGDLFSDAGPETHVTVAYPGSYEICLVIETFDGCVDTFCNPVTVEEGGDDCEAVFTFETEGLTIYLNGYSSTPLDQIVSWHWFINGDLFSDAGPETHVTVAYPGTYEICLVIETSDGCVDTLCHPVTVEEGGGDCEAAFTFETEGLTIYLDGHSSTPLDQIVSWHWFINGDLFSDNGPEAHYTVDEPGTYELCLVIETSFGCADTFCHAVSVEEADDNCEAAFTFETEGLTIYLDGHSSTPLDQIVSWHWFINGDLFSDNGPEAHYTVDDPGTYELCLVIETSFGCADTFCHPVSVEEADDDCEAAFTFETEGFTIYLDGHSSVPLDQIVSWHWFINGDLFSDNGPETHVTVAYPGTYEICLVIETSDGCVDTICHEVTVEEESNDCEAAFTFETAGLTIYLNGHSSTPLDQIVSWHWFINGDLFSDAGPETHVTVAYPGTYEICLVIETSDGCVDTICHEVTVEEENDDCEAAFTFETDGLTIYVNGHSSTPLDQIVSWHWFINGDLFSDNGPESLFTVDYSGTYEICLVIETSEGCVDTFCHSVTIEQLQDDGNEMKLYTGSDGSTIIIMLSAMQNSGVNISISSITGKVVFSTQQIVYSGSTQFIMNSEQRLTPGVYFITAEFIGQETITAKAIILR